MRTYEYSKRTWAQIDLDALANNVAVINKRLRSDGDAKIMAIVKADAYGHGAPVVAAELERLGVRMFGVSCFDEAVQLRRAGIDGDILILGYTEPNVAGELAEYGLIQTIFDEPSAKAVFHAAKKTGRKVRAHIKADTGMNRLGFKFGGAYGTGEAGKIAKIIGEYDGWIEFEGLYTHFASSDEEEEFTREQFDRFMELSGILDAKGLKFKTKHCCNSAGFANFPEMGLDYVRCGGIVYGLYPSGNAPIDGLKPVMTLYTTIAQVHPLKKGETVSYGRTFTAESDMVAAAVPIGYADGFSRLFSGKISLFYTGGESGVKGECPVLGRICMDQSVIDVSERGNVRCGDRVIVFGGNTAENINSADSLAAILGTINYEIVCLIGKRVTRIYTRNGEEAERLNYIDHI